MQTSAVCVHLVWRLVYPCSASFWLWVETWLGPASKGVEQLWSVQEAHTVKLFFWCVAAEQMGRISWQRRLIALSVCELHTRTDWALAVCPLMNRCSHWSWLCVWACWVMKRPVMLFQLLLGCPWALLFLSGSSPLNELEIHSSCEGYRFLYRRCDVSMYEVLSSYGPGLVLVAYPFCQHNFPPHKSSSRETFADLRNGLTCTTTSIPTMAVAFFHGNFSVSFFFF